MSLRRGRVAPAAPAAALAARAVAVIAAVALLASGCGTGLSAAGGGTSGGRPQVVAAFYPLEFVARQVGGSDIIVRDLTKPGVEPHEMELNPRQVATISEAALVLYLKGLQPAVDEAVEQNPPKASLDATTIVPLVVHQGGVDEDAEAAHGKAASPGAEQGSSPADEHAKDPHISMPRVTGPALPT